MEFEGQVLCGRFGIPLGAEKWMTLPSDLNMLTSSI